METLDYIVVRDVEDIGIIDDESPRNYITRHTIIAE